MLFIHSALTPQKLHLVAQFSVHLLFYHHIKPSFFVVFPQFRLIRFDNVDNTVESNFYWYSRANSIISSLTSFFRIALLSAILIEKQLKVTTTTKNFLAYENIRSLRFIKNAKKNVSWWYLRLSMVLEYVNIVFRQFINITWVIIQYNSEWSLM